MSDEFPENDDYDEMNYDHQQTPFLAVNFVQQVDELVSLAHYGPSIVLITGEDGIGKTVILEQLENETSDLGVVRIDGTPMLGVDQLHASFLQQLNSYDQPVEFNSVRDSLLIASEETDQLILVDDAQQLSLSVLETLLSLVAPVEQSPTNLIRLFLFGNDDLEQQINISSYPQSAVYKLPIKGLHKDEIASFLGHLLNISDVNVEQNYGSKYINKLWKHSSGNPGSIIRNLNQTDSEEELIEEENNWSGLLFRSILAILGIGLLVLAIFGEGWWPSADKTIEKVKAEEATENNALKVPIDSTEAVESIDSAIEKFPEAKPLISVELSENPEQKPEIDEKIIDEVVSEEKTGVEKGLESLKEKDNKQAIDGEILAVGESIKTTSVENETLSKVTSETVDKTITNEEVLSVQADDYTAVEQQLLAVPAKHYSIQLVGLSKLDDIQQFVKTLAPEQETFIYRSLLNGQPWYILITGDYVDADTARNAKEKLQASMKKLKPWIKSYTVIQQQIRQARNAR